MKTLGYQRAPFPCAPLGHPVSSGHWDPPSTRAPRGVRGAEREFQKGLAVNVRLWPSTLDTRGRASAGARHCSRGGDAATLAPADPVTARPAPSRRSHAVPTGSRHLQVSQTPAPACGVLHIVESRCA